MKKPLLSLAILFAAFAGAKAQGTVLLADTAFTTIVVNGKKVSQLFAPGGNTLGSGYEQSR